MGPRLRRLLRHRLARGPRRPALPRSSRSSRTSSRRTPSTSRTSSTSRAADHGGAALLRHRLLGRDTFSRVIYGMRTSLWVALVVSLLATVIGTTVGAAAATSAAGRQRADAAHRPRADAPGPRGAAHDLGLRGQGDPRGSPSSSRSSSTGFARIVRGTFLSLREKEFVEAAKASGAGDWRIIIRHMLPNAVGPIIVNATLIVAAAILTEAASRSSASASSRRPGARRPHRRGPERRAQVLVARHVPRARDRPDRALHQLHRRRPPRRPRSDPEAGSCLSRSVASGPGGRVRDEDGSCTPSTA